MKNNLGKNNKRILIAGCALICFALIAYFVSKDSVIMFDTIIRQWFYDLRNPFLNGIMIFITYLGNWQSVVLLCLVLLIIKKTRKSIGLTVSVTAIISTVLYKIIKEIFKRARPDVAVRIIKQGGYSFPSGHSFNCIVIYGLLIYLIGRYCKNKKTANILTALISILIFLIGISRIYVGVHFPTDVLGGWSLGIAFLVLVINILEGKRKNEEL